MQGGAVGRWQPGKPRSDSDSWRKNHSAEASGQKSEEKESGEVTSPLKLPPGKQTGEKEMPSMVKKAMFSPEASLVAVEGGG